MKLLTLMTTPLLLLPTSASKMRFVMYHDSYHPTRPTSPTDRASITHLILAFAQANNTAAYTPHVPISTLRSEFPNANLSIAIGGWGDTSGFSAAAASGEPGLAKFATDVKALVDRLGVDGVDIDWEYPGGNGADYKQIPNERKTGEIDAFPRLLRKVREALGPERLVSIAVPGKKGDMIAFTRENGEGIWGSVDFVNIMTYDLMNRRDTLTAHHTSVQGSAQTVQNYLDIGLPPSKINLGMAFYAKYFLTTGDCTSSPLNCPIALAEDPITGADTLTSGAWTFEKAHMQTPQDPSTIPVSTDGTCGAEKGTRCATGCCSQYGNCGTSKEHCSGACQHAFGTGCTDADIAGSWQLAARNGVMDRVNGGQYFFDAKNKLFWTWDTTELIARKFEEVVKRYRLGGVMAWSLGEDSNDWSHIRAMAEGVKRLEGNVQSLDTTPAPAQKPESSKSKTKPKSKPKPKPKQTPSTRPAKAYDVVYVDGIGGPDAEESGIPTPPKGASTPAGPVSSTKPKNAAADPDPESVVAVAGPKGKYAEPRPNDDWEWVWYDENGKPWQDRKQRMRMERV